MDQSELAELYRNRFPSAELERKAQIWQVLCRHYFQRFVPDGATVLLDANGKKVRFCRQAALELGLRNVEVVQARVEAYIPALPFDTLAARAVADLPSLLASVGHLLGPRTTLLARKGALPAPEVELLRQEGLVVTTHRLDVPGVGGERHLIQIGRRGSDG